MASGRSGPLDKNFKISSSVQNNQTIKLNKVQSESENKNLNFDQPTQAQIQTTSVSRNSTGNNYVILKPKFLNKDSTFEKILQSYDAVDVGSKGGQDIIKSLSSESVTPNDHTSVNQAQRQQEEQKIVELEKPFLRANSKPKPKFTSTSLNSNNNFKTKIQTLLENRPTNEKQTSALSNLSLSSLKSVEILKSAKIHKPIVDTNLRKPKRADTTKNFELVEIYNQNPLSNSLKDIEKYESVGEKLVRIAVD